MSSTTIKKIIPCKKDQLIKMVLDIEKYPEFVPWCIEGKAYDKVENNDLTTNNNSILDKEYIKSFSFSGVGILSFFKILYDSSMTPYFTVVPPTSKDKQFIYKLMIILYFPIV